MNLLEINATKLFEILNSDADKGLKSVDVEKNRKEFSSTVHSSKSLMAVIRSIFGDVMPLLFIFLSLLSFSFKGNAGSWLSLALFAIVYTAFKFLSVRYSAKVSKMLNVASTKVTVVRDGMEQVIDYSDLVPGDIMLLKVGDVVPCDAMVLWQNTLRVSEIQLTGNSVPVLKLTQEDVLRGKGVPYYECIIFAGSVVLFGAAKVLVCNTGREVFDKKNKLTSRSKHARKTKVFEISAFISQQISLIWILLSFVIFVFGTVKGQAVFDILLLAVTMAVASLPDLAITLFDLTLSVGSRRLLKKGCIIRDMSSIDRMCDISCIIVDDSKYFRTSSPKPSTVYVNDVRKRFRGAGDDDVRELFEYAVMASVSRDNGMTYNGISVEHSLIKCAEEMGITPNSLYDRYPLLEKRPFTEANGMSRALVFHDGEFFIISIGSPSPVLHSCSYIETNGVSRILGERERIAVRETSRAIARENEGVIAVAVKKIEYREGDGQINENRGYTFKGYIGLHTPIKADAARAVSICKKAGTDVVLMTHEGRSTSIGFAKSLSLLKDDEKVIEGKELEKLDLGVFRADINSYKVYVGLTPEQKANTVSYRKEDGDIIAVTASEADDLGLLLESDVSFCPSDCPHESMRQNSDVITNGSFEMIPECIKYARSIYSNTRHTLQYLLNFQFVLLFTVIISLMFLGRVVFSPVATMIYAVTVVLPLAFSLAVRDLRGNELKDTIGSQNLRINAQNLLLIPAICGLVSGTVINLSAKSAILLNVAQSSVNGSAFITLITSSVFMAWALSTEDSFDVSVFKNKYLWITTVTSFGIMALFTLTPPLARFVGVGTVTGEGYALSIITGFIPTLVCMGIKLVKKYVFNNNEK